MKWFWISCEELVTVDRRVCGPDKLSVNAAEARKLSSTAGAGTRQLQSSAYSSCIGGASPTIHIEAYRRCESASLIGLHMNGEGCTKGCIQHNSWAGGRHTSSVILPLASPRIRAVPQLVPQYA